MALTGRSSNVATETVRPRTVAEAVAALEGGRRRVVAGATWIMRGHVRGEEPVRSVVFIADIPELGTVSVQPDCVIIGTGVTHAALVETLTPLEELKGLATAAGKSANPAIRAVATVGGNLCAAAFAAGDLAPQLLCLDATVQYVTKAGTEEMPIETFLARRAMLTGGLLTRVTVPRGAFRSVHARLPLRQAGDYPVAIVSMRADAAAGGRARGLRVAVGSVEASPRRWRSLEEKAEGLELDPASIGAIAATLTDAFEGRDGIEAPGWYRRRVLPALVGQAIKDLRRQVTETT